MARSSYIYVVTSVLDYEPIAGFTVKHELMSWLCEHPAEHFVWRIRDGRHGQGATDITEEIVRAMTPEPEPPYLVHERINIVDGPQPIEDE